MIYNIYYVETHMFIYNAYMCIYVSYNLFYHYTLSIYWKTSLNMYYKLVYIISCLVLSLTRLSQCVLGLLGLFYFLVATQSLGGTHWPSAGHTVLLSEFQLFLPPYGGRWKSPDALSNFLKSLNLNIVMGWGDFSSFLGPSLFTFPLTLEMAATLHSKYFVYLWIC
jgi:hypothetical protein